MRGKVDRAIVKKQVLDELIRAKLQDTEVCKGVKPLPVAWRVRSNGGCNWTIPGWTGDSAAVFACTERMRQYLQLLKLRYDIPEEA